MRREGYELAVSRPEVIIKEIDGAADGAGRAAGGRHGRAVPGRRDGDASASARRQLQEHGTRRQGPRAPGLHDSGARPDRLPDRVPHAHRRHRPAVPRVRPLRSEGRRRDRQAPERRDDLQRHRPLAGLRADRDAGTRPPVRRAEGDEIYEGQLVGIHSKDNDLTVNALRGQAADQHPRVGQGRRRSG